MHIDKNKTYLVELQVEQFKYCGLKAQKIISIDERCRFDFKKGEVTYLLHHKLHITYSFLCEKTSSPLNFSQNCQVLLPWLKLL